MKVFRSTFLVLCTVMVVTVSVLPVSVSASTTTDHERTHRELNPVERGTPTNCQASDFALPPALMDAATKAQRSPELFGLIGAMQEGWTPGFSTTETPIVARLVHLIDTIDWNCAAMYSATWLDGLTKQAPLVRAPVSFIIDPVTSHEEIIIFHASTPRFLCMVHAWAAVVEDWHPWATTTLQNALSAFQYDDVSYGFNADVDEGFDLATGEPNTNKLIDIAARNCYKPKIMGAIVARQVTEYGQRDGYNMYGDLGRDGRPCHHNCRRYTDSTGYGDHKSCDSNTDCRHGTVCYEVSTDSFLVEELRCSSNNADADEESGCYCQRKTEEKFQWKPMLEDNGRGYFTQQQHVTPHIGFTATRAILSTEDFTQRVAQGLTDETETTHNTAAIKVMERLKHTATNDTTKAQIEFYDNKLAVGFAVLGSVAAYGLSFEQLMNFAWGITAAEYDAILVAWKEKILHDRVRPTTWIQTRMAEQEFTTYGGPTQGVRKIKGKEFESWTRVMPHSEYISGSACICEAMKDFTDAWMNLTSASADLPVQPPYDGAPVYVPGASIQVFLSPQGGSTTFVAPFREFSSTTEPGVSPASNVTLTVDTMSDLATQCGNSRLDGGMHFEKAVTHAYDLCHGIGTLAANYSQDLLGVGGWQDSTVPTRTAAPIPAPLSECEEDKLFFEKLMQWMLEEEYYEEDSYAWEFEREWMAEAEEYQNSSCEDHIYMDRIQSFDNDLLGNKSEAAIDYVSAHPGADAKTSMQF